MKSRRITNAPSHAWPVSEGTRLFWVSATSLHVLREVADSLVIQGGGLSVDFLHIWNEHMTVSHGNSPCFTSELRAGYCRGPQTWSVLSASHLFSTKCRFPSSLWILEPPVPLSASPSLSACVLPLLHLHIFPVSGYGSLLRYHVCSRLDMNAEEQWNW